jgi:hypothetical protein
VAVAVAVTVAPSDALNSGSRLRVITLMFLLQWVTKKTGTGPFNERTLGIGNARPQPLPLMKGREETKKKKNPHRRRAVHMMG